MTKYDVAQLGFSRSLRSCEKLNHPSRFVRAQTLPSYYFTKRLYFLSHFTLLVYRVMILILMG